MVKLTRIIDFRSYTNVTRKKNATKLMQEQSKSSPNLTTIRSLVCSKS